MLLLRSNTYPEEADERVKARAWRLRRQRRRDAVIHSLANVEWPRCRRVFGEAEGALASKVLSLLALLVQKYKY